VVPTGTFNNVPTAGCPMDVGQARALLQPDRTPWGRTRFHSGTVGERHGQRQISLPILGLPRAARANVLDAAALRLPTAILRRYLIVPKVRHVDGRKSLRVFWRSRPAGFEHGHGCPA